MRNFHSLVKHVGHNDDNLIWENLERIKLHVGISENHIEVEKDCTGKLNLS